MSKRIISLGVAFAILLTFALGRCGYINFSNSYKVDSSYNSITVDISTLFTNIYSRNGVLLNNNTHSLYAVIKPSEKSMAELKYLYSNDDIKYITDELKKGYPVVMPVKNYAYTKYIRLEEIVNQNNDNMLCKHLIDKNFSGLEKYVDKKIGSLSINYSVDALGRVLDGDNGTIINKNYNSIDGVKISIDEKLQKIAEDSSKTISKGSVVILDTNTSQILASVSLGGDYLNRSLRPYAIGSIFKIVVAAAALENNINPQYDCKSKIKVGDTTFHCQNKHKHGKQHIKEALANSCNCYFVNLALKLGKDKILNTAKAIGFGESFNLFDNTFPVTDLSFPNEEELNSKGQLALLGFGQGKLTDNPLHFASVVSAVANGGYYNFPTLNINSKDNKRAFSAKTAQTLKEYMKYVVDNGTGFNAQYESNTAGKTATAQTGIYEDGKEQLNTWFVGFYPYDKPEYSIAIMCEGGKSGAEDCCPVFRSIVESIDKM